MPDTTVIITAFFLLANLFAFSVMFVDKSRSRRTGVDRISEGTLFFLAAAFGGPGVLAGMFAFRHKTRKWYFLVGIPLLILQNLAFLFLLSSFLPSP